MTLAPGVRNDLPTVPQPNLYRNLSLRLLLPITLFSELLFLFPTQYTVRLH